jgi:hypothetical protein
MDAVLYMLVFIASLISLIMMYFIFKNRNDINNMEDDSEIKMKNIINAVNYNDDVLLKNQKYLNDVYEENDTFTKENVKEKIDSVSVSFMNLMNNYDAVSDLSL